MCEPFGRLIVDVCTQSILCYSCPLSYAGNCEVTKPPARIKQGQKFGRQGTAPTIRKATTAYKHAGTGRGGSNESSLPNFPVASVGLTHTLDSGRGGGRILRRSCEPVYTSNTSLLSSDPLQKQATVCVTARFGVCTSRFLACTRARRTRVFRSRQNGKRRKRCFLTEAI